jgi:hypothetical protein
MVDVTEEFDRDCAWGGRIRRMAERIEELEREDADLKRHNPAIRDTVAALLAPPVSKNFTHSPEAR